MKSQKIAILAAVSLCLSGTTFAQESTETDQSVNYEFRFTVQSAETHEAQTARLEREVGVYCEGMTANLHCEDEITDAVNRKLRADRHQRKR